MREREFREEDVNRDEEGKFAKKGTTNAKNGGDTKKLNQDKREKLEAKYNSDNSERDGAAPKNSGEGKRKLKLGERGENGVNTRLLFAILGDAPVVISDDGTKRRILTENENVDFFSLLRDSDGDPLGDDEKREVTEKYLREAIEDDSSWIETDETVDEIIERDEGIAGWRKVYADIEKEM